MAFYETKTIGSQLLDINEKDGIVQFLGNSFKVDSDRERFEQNAFDASITEFGPLGTVKAHRIHHLYAHGPNDFIGKFTTVRSETRGLFAESQLIPTEPHGRNAILGYTNELFEHSVGFTREAANAADAEGVVVITKARLWEISTLLWGADMNTPAFAFKSEHDPGFRDELAQRIAAMQKCIASPLTDGFAGRLELHLAQLEAFAEVLKAKADPTDSRFTLDAAPLVDGNSEVTAKEALDHALYLDGLYGLRWKHHEARLKHIEDATVRLEKAAAANPLSKPHSTPGTPNNTLLAHLLAQVSGDT